MGIGYGELVTEVLLAILILVNLYNRRTEVTLKKEVADTQTTLTLNEVVENLQTRIGDLEVESNKKEQQIRIMIKMIKSLRQEAAKVPVLEAQVQALRDELARRARLELMKEDFNSE